MSHPEAPPILRSSKPAIDADFSILAFELRTDNTKRCDVTVLHSAPLDCTAPAAWFAQLSCNVGHGVATCTEHRAHMESLVAGGYVVSCKSCDVAGLDIIWRPL